MNGIGTSWIPSQIKRGLKNAWWRIYGAFLANPPVPAAPRSFLFVCKGNICRSPFAEEAARKHFTDMDENAIRSAGIFANSLQGCPSESFAAAETFGIDLSEHKPTQIDEELVIASDMVFAMEAWHYRGLRKTFPKHREKIFLLAPFESSPPARSEMYDVLNIRDPYGREMKDFILCFGRIDACLRGLFSTIHGNAKALMNPEI